MSSLVGPGVTLKEKISQSLVKYAMPTRQAAINEIVHLSELAIEAGSIHGNQASTEDWEPDKDHIRQYISAIEEIAEGGTDDALRGLIGSVLHLQKQEIRGKGERLKNDSQGIYNLIPEGEHVPSWANGYIKGIEKLLED
jgi:hypothetical protein